MVIDKIAYTLDRSSRKIAGAFAAVSIISLIMMMLYVVSDVFMRFFFGAPFKGSYEGVQIFMSIVFPYGIAWTQKEKGHVAVNIIISRFSMGIQRFVEIAIYAVYFVTVVTLIWRILIRAREVVVNNETTYGAVAPFERLSLGPFYYLLAVAFIPLAVVVLSDLFNALKQGREQ